MPKVISGKWQRGNGNPMAGFTLYIQPTQDSVAVGNEQVGVAAIPYTLDATGSIPAATTNFFSDELSPQVPFICTVKNVAGGIEWGPETVLITGASFDFRTVVPGTVPGLVIGGQVIVSNPTSAQTITGQSLTLASSSPLIVLGNITATAGQNILASYSISTIRIIDGIKFANSQAGIQAAITDIGASAGFIIIPPNITGSAGDMTSVTSSRMDILILDMRGGRNVIAGNNTGGSGSTFGILMQLAIDKDGNINYALDLIHELGSISGHDLNVVAGKGGAEDLHLVISGSGNIFLDHPGSGTPTFRCGGTVPGAVWVMNQGAAGTNGTFSIINNNIDGRKSVTIDTSKTTLNWIGTGISTASLVIGDQGNNTGSAIFVNTPSLNSSFASGLGIDGTYSNPGGIGTAVVNVKACGVSSGGGYDAALSLQTALGATLTEVMKLQRGVTIGAPTGGDKGAGTVNATAFFVNGVGIGGDYSKGNATPVTVNANTAADQNLMSDTIPANTLNVVGRSLMLQCSFIYSTPVASTATVTIKVKLGSLTLLTLTSTANAGNITNNPIHVTAWITTQTAGASAAFEAHGDMAIDLGALSTAADTVFIDNNTATIGTLDSTASQTLQITAAFSAASASNSISQRQMIEDTLG